MKKLIFLSLAILCCSCKSKKTLTFEQKYEQANKLYERKKFSKAVEMYEDIYPELPNKIDSVKVLKKLADCLYQEKRFKSSYDDYKTLYETINDEDRLMNGFRMCNCFFNLLEKNNKRDISRVSMLLDMIDSVLEEYENVETEQEKKILEDLKVMRQNVSNKIRTLIKNQFLSASSFETRNKKNMTDEKKNILFEKWKDIILTFDSYKEELRGDKKSENFYEQALKKINLQK